MNPAESCEEKVLFLGGKTMTKLMNLQETQLASPSQGGDCMTHCGPKSYKPTQNWGYRRLLRVSLGALGGPILGFWGVGLAAELGFT